MKNMWLKRLCAVVLFLAGGMILTAAGDLWFGDGASDGRRVQRVRGVLFFVAYIAAYIGTAGLKEVMFGSTSGKLWQKAALFLFLYTGIFGLGYFLMFLFS